MVSKPNAGESNGTPAEQSSTTMKLRQQAALMRCMTLGPFADAPWLASRSHPLLSIPRLASMAGSLEREPLARVLQAKAFCESNSADIFYSSGNEGLSWICFEGSCADLAQQAWGDRETTLRDATSRSQAPISARVASRDRGYAAPDATADGDGQGDGDGDGDGDGQGDGQGDACRAVTPELAKPQPKPDPNPNPDSNPEPNTNPKPAQLTPELAKPKPKPDPKPDPEPKPNTNLTPTLSLRR